MPVDYGATVEGVRSHALHLRITEDSKPSIADVTGYIEAQSNLVAARAGDFSGNEPAVETAKAIVEIGAASWAVDAAAPERAGRGDQSYGTVLWNRRNELMKELLELLGIDDEGGGAAVGALPDFYFPPPIFRRDVGF